MVLLGVELWGRVEVGDELLDEHLMGRSGESRVGALLQPAQRRRRGERVVPRNRRLERHIPAQRLMVVEVLVAQRRGEHALAQQRLKPMPAAPSLAHVLKPPRETTQQPRALVDFAKKHPPASEVIAPPLKSASTTRRPIGDKRRAEPVHFGIGEARSFVDPCV